MPFVLAMAELWVKIMMSCEIHRKLNLHQRQILLLNWLHQRTAVNIRTWSQKWCHVIPISQHFLNKWYIKTRLLVQVGMYVTKDVGSVGDSKVVSNPELSKPDHFHWTGVSSLSPVSDPCVWTLAGLCTWHVLWTILWVWHKSCSPSSN